jgi:hypothetical protein
LAIKIIGFQFYLTLLATRSSLSRPANPPYLPFTGEVRTEMVEAAGYSGASDDYYEVNPTLDPENVAAGVRFMLSLPYKVQVRSAPAS